MFLINLFPYFARNNPVSYSWIGALAAKKLGLENVILVGSSIQLAPPSSQRHHSWIADQVQEITDHEWASVAKIEIPEDILFDLYDKSQDGLNFLFEVSTSQFSQYVEYLANAVSCLTQGKNLSAGFSLANDKSFEAVCNLLNIPIIFSEGGPVRRPDFPFGTYFFDHKGINGAHSFESVYSSAKQNLNTSKFLEPHIIRNDLYKGRDLTSDQPETFELGVALQVEDDSNLITYSRGVNSLQILFKALWVFPRDLILVRQHPLSKFLLRDNEFGVIDNSDSSLSFLQQCKRLLTINSSVAFEAILLGKETYVLGSSPLNLYAESHVDRRLIYSPKTHDETRYFLNVFFFVYLIPEWYWLNKRYFDFRLSNPSMQAIFDLHMASYVSRGFFTDEA
jgi:hypothetical protein